MKEIKIFTIGSATFDIFVRPEEQEVMKLKNEGEEEKYLCLEYGAKVRTKEVHETYGGGAANLAVGFSRMGFQAYPVTKIGEMYGEKVCENLEKEKVNTDFVAKTKREKTAFSIIMNIFDGDRTVMAYPGANQYLTAKDLPLDEMAEADWIYLGHLANEKSGIPAAILKLLKKHPKIKLAWNPGHEQFLQGFKKWKEMLKRTEVLFLNKEEASKFTGLPYDQARVRREKRLCHIHAKPGLLPPYANDVTQIMHALVETGVKNVVITDGINGSQATDGKRHYFCPVENSKRVDSLGAGDAFATGFVTALVLQKSLKQALTYGTLNASSVVGHFGAQAGLLQKGELMKRSKATDLCITSSKL